MNKSMTRGRSGLTPEGRILFNPQDIGDLYYLPYKTDPAKDPGYPIGGSRGNLTQTLRDKVVL
jgi:hypothetical protein